MNQSLMVAAQTAGADTIAGSARADTITGGTGNDSIDGREGADVYLFNRGDGQDTISDTGAGVGQDRIEFGANIGEADVDFAHGTNFNDLVIAIRNTTDRITVKDYFAAGGAKIGEIVLKDGTALFAAAIPARAVGRQPPAPHHQPRPDGGQPDYGQDHRAKRRVQFHRAEQHLRRHRR